MANAARSVARLMKERGRSKESPDDVIRRIAAETIDYAANLGWSGPAFCPRLLASTLGIRVEDRKVLSGEAQLTPTTGNRFLIEVDPRPPVVRQNYSICHEIVHTFFPDCADQQRHRDVKRVDEVERLCQLGAAELLLPETAFHEASATWGTSLNGVAELGGMFQASYEAVIRRLLSMADEPVAAVFFSRRLKPTERSGLGQNLLFDDCGPVEKMRVLYCASSASWSAYIPKEKSVEEDSAVARCEQSLLVQQGIENWGCAGLRDLRVESLALPPIENSDAMKVPSVVALIKEIY